MTATVTEISAAPSVRVKHSWLEEPRADDPTRHIRTCRRDGCGLRKRSELVDGEWLWFWLWPDRAQGSGKKVPACRGGAVVEPPSAPLALAAVPVEAASTPPCCRCRPPLEPCNQPTHPYLGGALCAWQAGLLSARPTHGGVA